MIAMDRERGSCVRRTEIHAQVATFVALTLIAALSLLGCGGGSSTLPPPATNPVPTIASISPNTGTQGGPAFNVTVTALDASSLPSCKQSCKWQDLTD